MDVDTTLKVLGVALALLGHALVIIKVIDGKNSYRMSEIDQRHKETIDSVRQEIANNHAHSARENEALHGRINDVKDDYVKRADHDREMRMINDNITSLKADIKVDLKHGLDSMNTRLVELQKAFTEMLSNFARTMNHRD